MTEAAGQTELADRVWFSLNRVEQVFSGMLERAPTDPERPELATDYLGLRRTYRAAVDDLKLKLEAALGTDKSGEGLAGSCLAALLIHYDERELARLAQCPSLDDLELLQTAYQGVYDGGDRFYTYLEDALRTQNTPELALQLFLFCLRSGFCGRYIEAEHPERQAKIRELEYRVAGDLTHGQVPAVSLPMPERIVGKGFPYHYYAIGFAVLMGIWLLLGIRAHLQQHGRMGTTTCEKR